MDEMEHLNKKERRRLRKQQKREERAKGERNRRFRKFLVLGVLLGVVVYIGFRIIGSRPEEIVGEEVVDLRAEHTQDISEIEYNSNPPTSGTHFPVWAKSGIYDRVLSDGYLIHSLEHGYIVVSYNCTKLPMTNNQFSIFNKVFAHEGEDDIPEDEPHPEDFDEASQSAEAMGSGEALTRMKVGVDRSISSFTPDNAPEAEVELPESFESEQCGVLKSKLDEFFQKNRSRRLIVVPRPNLDVSVALTAWNRILKMDEWGEAQAQEFVKQWENKGPEQTVE